MITSIKPHKSDVSPYINWEITSSCNFRCDYCSYAFGKGHLSLDRAKYIIDKVSASKHTPSIGITGGEPTLNPEFGDILKYTCNKMNNGILVVTNATMDTNKIKRILSDIPNTDRIWFYLTYHHGQTDIDRYVGFANAVKDCGVRLCIKPVCIPDKFDEIKNIFYNHLCHIKYDMMYMKHVRGHLSSDCYTDSQMDWMVSHTNNNELYHITYDDGHSEDLRYCDMVHKKMNNFRGMYCTAYKILCINILGRIHYNCFGKVIGNIHTIESIDEIYDREEWCKCIQRECTFCGGSMEIAHDISN